MPSREHKHIRQSNKQCRNSLSQLIQMKDLRSFRVSIHEISHMMFFKVSHAHPVLSFPSSTPALVLADNFVTDQRCTINTSKTAVF